MMNPLATGRWVVAAVGLGAAIPSLVVAQTTTTTSVAPGTSSTTTTTLIDACGTDTSFTSLDCRAAALGARLAAAGDLGRTKTTLTTQAGKLDRLLTEAAAASAANDPRQARTKLKKAGRVLVSMGFRLRSLRGRRNIPAPTRAELTATVNALRTDLAALGTSL